MTQSHYSLPRIKITVTHTPGPVTYQLENYHTDTSVIQVENGVMQAIIRASDYQGETFLNKVDIDDVIKIEYNFSDKDSTWTQVFGGYVWDLTPTQDAIGGEIVTIKARGYGVALLAMPVGQEYGIESTNPSLDTIHEILKDNTSGIIDKWVNKVLNTANDSEFSVDDTKVDTTLATSFRYLYWPFVPAAKCVDDMCDLIMAVTGTGAHWIVIPSGTTPYLCVSTVGNHANPPSDVWPTWWKTNQAGSTFTVKEDMITSMFRKQKSEATYILYCGKLVKPANEIWTENKSGDWGFTSVGGAGAALVDDNAIYVVNSYSLRCDTSGQVGGGIEVYYPSGMAANWDILKWCGEYTIPTFNFYIRRDANIGVGVAGGTPFLNFHTDAANYYEYSFGSLLPQSGKWYLVSLPLGPKANIYSKGQQSSTAELTASPTLNPDWADIDYFKFRFAQTNGVVGKVYLDGLHFSSRIIRGARDDTKIGTQKCRVKVITDDVGKDDIGRSGTPGTTDLGMMAQIAKAELYRSITTPILGSIVVPGQETIWAGQLCHVKFGEKADGTYNIDSNFRIMKVTHRFAPIPHGFRSYLDLTDDVTNAHPMQPSTAYNLIKKASNPDYSTRERGSIKARDIDITLPLLTENYST